MIYFPKFPRFGTIKSYAPAFQWPAKFGENLIQQI